MSTMLHRDPIHGGGAHLLRLPSWVPPKAPGFYWHQPRSGWIRSDGRVHLRFWCGATRRAQTMDLSLLSDLPPVDLRCGTCVGREAGYQRRDGVIFRPHDHWALPTWCPGGQDHSGKCLACGSGLRWYGAFASGPSRHHPHARLAERITPCPQHGWRSMRAFGYPAVMVGCGEWRCEHIGGPR